MAVESGTGLSRGGCADRAPARAEGGGALRSAARRVLRPVWRSLSFHARFRLRRLSNPARWRCLFSRSRHAAELRSILDLHRGRPAVVCVPTQEWNDLFQRPQQLARALADRGALVFYLTPGVRRDRRAGFEEVEPRLYVANVSAGAMAGLRDAVAIVAWLPERDLLARICPAKLVYDHMDDLSVFYRPGTRLLSDHRALIRKADVVTVSARVLAAAVRELGVEPLLLPNGVDLLRFVPTGRTPSDLGPILARGQPVIGYHGSLARWFDYRLLLAAARARPGWQFVLVGPADFDDSWDRRALAAQENLHWLGPKSHSELPDYLRSFDVGTIPFKVNSITRACSPIKLFEYFALGKPVAVTALDECRGFRGVQVAETPEDYPAALDRALEASRDPRCAETLKAEAASHTWARRADDLWTRLFGGRPAGVAGAGSARGDGGA